MTFDQAVPYLLALIALGVAFLVVAAVRRSLSERRNVVDLDARLTRMTHDSAARDRVAPMTAWKDDER